LEFEAEGLLIDTLYMALSQAAGYLLTEISHPRQLPSDVFRENDGGRGILLDALRG
jgi:hypothetical protein